MHPLSFVGLALVAGFMAGHGFDLSMDLLPLVVAITAGFVALSLTGVLNNQK